MNFKISLSTKHADVDIVPEDAPEYIHEHYKKGLSFEDAKAIVINYLECEKERIDIILNHVGNMTKESCIDLGNARKNNHVYR